MEDKKNKEVKNPLQTKIVTQVGKLLSERSKKVSGYSHAYVYEPADFFEKQYGTLYFVLEIASPDPYVIEIGDVIIETLKEEYYADLDRDPLVSFESALKAVNKELANLAASGKTGWFNKINAICACLSEKTFHLTQVGSAECYLLRNNQLNHISEGLYSPGEKPDPLKTFVNIASGDLEPEDKILISTPGLFYSMSLDNIKKIIADNSPSKTAKKLAGILKGEEDALGTSLLIIRITTEDQISNEINEEEEEIWIAEPKSKLKTISEKTKPFLSKSKIVLGKGLDKIKHTSKKTVLPLIDKASTKIKNLKDKKDKINTVSEPIIKKEPGLETEASSKITSENLEKTEKLTEISSKKTEIEKTITEKIKPSYSEKSHSISKSFQFKTFLSKTSKWFLSLISEIKAGKSQKPDKYFYLTIITLIIFISSIGIFYYKQKTNKELQRVKEIYNNAFDKEQKAEAALIYKDREQAKNLLQKAYSEAESIKNNKIYKEKVEKLMDKIREQQDKADMVYRIKNPSVVADFNQTDEKIQTTNLFIIGPDYYTFQENGNVVYRYQTKDKKIIKITKSLTSGKFQTATQTSDNTIILYDNGPGVSEYNPIDNSITPQIISLGGNWEKCVAIAAYQNYLYVLSPQNNKIYRHAKTLGGYSVGVDYLTNTNINLSKAISLTIGETVFVLESDGKILEFTKGTEIPFNIKNMSSSFEKPNIIFTRTDYNYIYITDQKRKSVTIIDYNGNYKGQYTSDNFKNIKGIDIDEIGKKIYLLSDNKVYSFNFNLD